MRQFSQSEHGIMMVPTAEAEKNGPSTPFEGSTPGTLLIAICKRCPVRLWVTFMVYFDAIASAIEVNQLCTTV